LAEKVLQGWQAKTVSDAEVLDAIEPFRQATQALVKYEPTTDLPKLLAAADEIKREASARQAQGAEPAWVTERHQQCETYKSMANDIKKSAVYASYFSSVKGRGGKLTDVPGKVTKISTTTGGGEVTLNVETQYGVISNAAGLNELFKQTGREIKKGSALYKAIGDLEVGSPVVVSVNNIVPEKNPFSEEVSLCELDWAGRFTSIKPQQ
jgi:hypothetical protein